MAKDNGYSARFIFITPPSPDDVVSRLTKDGKLSEDSIQEAKQNAIADLEQSKNGEHFYDIIITNDDVEKAYESLERFIYDTSPKTNGGNEPTGEDVAMGDIPSEEADLPKETNEPAEA